MKKSYNLELTEEEIKAIQDYTGDMHAKINAIADLKYDKLNRLTNNSWNLEMSTEELEMVIQKFVDIYSAIYKAGNRDTTGRLFRGTSQAELQTIGGSQIAKTCLSTSLDEEIAKTFVQPGKEAAIVIINKEEGLPSLYVEPYKTKEEKRNEEEVLILPFSKVKKLEYSNNWQGRAYYTATLEKTELEQIPEQELETLKTKLIEGYQEFTEKIIECRNLEENRDYLLMKLKEQGLDAEEKKLYSTQLNEKSSQYTNIREELDTYREEFTKLLKGMCKQRELEIDRQQEIENEKIEVMKTVKLEEERKQLETEIRNLENELEYAKTDITETLEQYMRQIEANATRYQAMADDLGVYYTKYPHFKNLENMQKIKRKLEEGAIKKQTEDETEEKDENEPSKEDLEKQYQQLLQEKQQLIGIQQIMKEMPKYIREHDAQSFQEITANVNQKVQNMITGVKLQQLQKEKEKALQEKDSKLQKLLYGTSLKGEKIRNIEIKMQWERKQAEMRNPENTIEVMMANLYDCCAQDLNGEFSPEMKEMIFALRRNYNNLPDEQILAEQAQMKATGNLPAVIGEKKLFKRKQIEYYRKDTERIKTEIMDREYYQKPIYQQVQINALSQYEESIDRIKNVLEKDEQQANRQIEQSGLVK